MFMCKVLISCALLVAAQAGYAPAPKYHKEAVLGGYAAHIQPAVTVTALHSLGGYGGHYAYGAPISSYAGHANSAEKALNAEALKLAYLGLALPPAGGPIPTTIHVPQYSTTLYSSPAVAAVPSSRYHASGSSAAAAASNIDSTYPVGAPAAPSYGHLAYGHSAPIY